MNRRVEILRVIFTRYFIMSQGRNITVLNLLIFFSCKNEYSLEGDSFRINDDPSVPFVSISQYYFFSDVSELLQYSFILLIIM